MLRTHPRGAHSVTLAPTFSLWGYPQRLYKRLSLFSISDPSYSKVLPIGRNRLSPLARTVSKRFHHRSIIFLIRKEAPTQSHVIPALSWAEPGQADIRHSRRFHFLSTIFPLWKEEVPCDSGPVRAWTQSVVQSLLVFGSVWFSHHVYKEAALQRRLPQFQSSLYPRLLPSQFHHKGGAISHHSPLPTSS